MTFNMNTTASERHHAVTASLSYVAAIFAKFRSAAGGVLKALQDARMMSTLAQMSDAQLNNIGISRSDIPDYAKKLMASEDQTTK